MNFISKCSGRPLEGFKQGNDGIRFTVTEVVLGVWIWGEVRQERKQGDVRRLLLQSRGVMMVLWWRWSTNRVC